MFRWVVVGADGMGGCRVGGGDGVLIQPTSTNFDICNQKHDGDPFSRHAAVRLFHLI